MDHIKQEFLKKLAKFIVILIWVSSLLITLNSHLYRFTIHLVTHAVDKNYMFLLSSALLAFVAKGIATSKPVEEGWSKTDKTFDYRDFESYDAILELEYYHVHEKERYSFLAEEVKTKEEKEDQETEEEKEKEEYAEPLTDNGDLEEECDIHGGFKEEEDNVGVVTEEEMNKRFDEFIRKMKEELRIEAKRHLIVV
ncbi:BnaCnng51360D [Brassica napus]|uniref:BnaCnng51360D protein n=2 Tax=Brassica napus TaxID=3708 RepID=A0A078JG00_BRANA|nr:BnaCnng51360D [Brassica napus]